MAGHAVQVPPAVAVSNQFPGAVAGFIQELSGVAAIPLPQTLLLPAPPAVHIVQVPPVKK